MGGCAATALHTMLFVTYIGVVSVCGRPQCGLRGGAYAKPTTHTQHDKTHGHARTQALWQLGDEARLATFSRALQRALEQAGVAAGAEQERAGAAAEREGGSSSSSGAGGGDAGVGGGGGAGGGASGGAEVVVVDGSLALGLLAASHPGVSSVTLLQVRVRGWRGGGAAWVLGCGIAGVCSIRPLYVH